MVARNSIVLSRRDGVATALGRGIGAICFAVVALSFSSQWPRDLYRRAKRWIDRIAAGAIAALGLHLMVSAGHRRL